MDWLWWIMDQCWFDCEPQMWVAPPIDLRSPGSPSRAPTRVGSAWESILFQWEELSQGNDESWNLYLPHEKGVLPSYSERRRKLTRFLDFCCPWVLFSLAREMGTWFSEAIPSPIQDQIALHIWIHTFAIELKYTLNSPYKVYCTRVSPYPDVSLFITWP